MTGPHKMKTKSQSPSPSLSEAKAKAQAKRLAKPHTGIHKRERQQPLSSDAGDSTVDYTNKRSDGNSDSEGNRDSARRLQLGPE